jgi:hypothetical protein
MYGVISLVGAGYSPPVQMHNEPDFSLIIKHVLSSAANGEGVVPAMKSPFRPRWRARLEGGSWDIQVQSQANRVPDKAI